MLYTWQEFCYYQTRLYKQQQQQPVYIHQSTYDYQPTHGPSNVYEPQYRPNNYQLAPTPISNTMLCCPTQLAPTPVSNLMLRRPTQLAPTPVSNPMLCCPTQLAPTPVSNPMLYCPTQLAITTVSNPMLYCPTQLARNPVSNAGLYCFNSKIRDNCKCIPKCSTVPALPTQASQTQVLPTQAPSTKATPVQALPVQVLPASVPLVPNEPGCEQLKIVYTVSGQKKIPELFEKGCPIVQAYNDKDKNLMLTQLPTKLLYGIAKAGNHSFTAYHPHYKEISGMTECAYDPFFLRPSSQLSSKPGYLPDCIVKFATYHPHYKEKSGMTESAYDSFLLRPPPKLLSLPGASSDYVIKVMKPLYGVPEAGNH